MKTNQTKKIPFWGTALAITVTLMGCEGEGPAIEANPQMIRFTAPQEPALDQRTATVLATASSDLAVQYSSLTPAICSVAHDTGLVTAFTSGTCIIAANQSGNERYAAAPQVTQTIVFTFTHTLVFSQPPASMNLHDQATVTAVDSLGLPINYLSDTPSVCSITGDTGQVTALAIGDCTIVARAGTLQARQTFFIASPIFITAPGSPTNVTAIAGDAPNTVLVHIGGTSSTGGSPITGYLVTSYPAGLSAQATTSPITVNCLESCSGYLFSVTAINEVGASPPSTPAEVITNYQVVETFFEPDTQPNDSIFVGSFTYNATQKTVTNLRGRLSESMTGGSKPYPDDTMIWLTLDYQLSAVPITLGGVEGLLVTTFLLTTTDTLSDDPTLNGTDGWSPGTGFGFYHGYPSGTNPGNAYARIFVNTDDPTISLQQEQIDKLAYADCAPGGMMGKICMTGTTVAGYGNIGTMSGYPVAQTITKQ